MDFKDRIKQYPYGKKENDRILAMSDKEFEKAAKDAVLFPEFAEPGDMGDAIIAAEEKYEYFRKLRESIKTDYPYGKKENDRILAMSDEEFEKAAKDAVLFPDFAEPGDMGDAIFAAEEKYEYFRKLRESIKEKNNQKENSIEK